MLIETTKDEALLCLCCDFPEGQTPLGISHQLGKAIFGDIWGKSSMDSILGDVSFVE